MSTSFSQSFPGRPGAAGSEPYAFQPRALPPEPLGPGPSRPPAYAGPPEENDRERLARALSATRHTAANGAPEPRSLLAARLDAPSLFRVARSLLSRAAGRAPSPDPALAACSASLQQILCDQADCARQREKPTPGLGGQAAVDFAAVDAAVAELWRRHDHATCRRAMRQRTLIASERNNALAHTLRAQNWRLAETLLRYGAALPPTFRAAEPKLWLLAERTQHLVPYLEAEGQYHLLALIARRFVCRPAIGPGGGSAFVVYGQAGKEADELDADRTVATQLAQLVRRAAGARMDAALEAIVPDHRSRILLLCSHGSLEGVHRALDAYARDIEGREMDRRVLQRIDDAVCVMRERVFDELQPTTLSLAPSYPEAVAARLADSRIAWAPTDLRTTE